MVINWSAFIQLGAVAWLIRFPFTAGGKGMASLYSVRHSTIGTPALGMSLPQWEETVYVTSLDGESHSLGNNGSLVVLKEELCRV